MARITGIDHVQLAMPVGAEAQARAFYAGVLGLPEIPKPAHLAVRGGAWFQCGPVQLHLGADAGFRAAQKAHPALTVEDLPTFLAALAALGIEVKPEEAVAGLQRATLADPFGNRVELIEQR
jgi:catechol 2,3-dioxygenase-like lactoylglutathione lyase family enzyme